MTAVRSGSRAGRESTAHRALVAGLAETRDLRAAGDYPAAAGRVRRLIAEAEACLGPHALQLVPALNELGMSGKYQGEFDEAGQAYRRALSILESHGATATADLAAVLHNLGGLAHASGDPMAAQRWARRGIEVRRALPEADPVALAADRAALAAILIDLGQHREARRILVDVLAGYGEDPVVHRHEIAVALHNLGSLHYRDGEFVAAAVTLRRAAALKRAALGAGHPDLGITLHNLARCQQHLGQWRSARRALLRAVDILEPVVAPTDPTLVACRRLTGRYPRSGSVHRVTGLTRSATTVSRVRAPRIAIAV